MEVHKELGSAFLKLFIMKLYGENFVSKELLLSPSPLFKFYIKEER